MATILLVEDDPLMSRMYTKALTLEGYSVALAVDGLEALEKVKTIRPSLILLDVMMPKMNGLQVLEKIKADLDTKDIPVIMLTNLTGEQEAEMATSKGALDYLIKSEAEPEQVITKIKEILAKVSQKSTV